MKQFYDVYADQPKLAALLRVLPWTHNLMILGQNKRPEEREFYLRLAVKAKWSSRELAHQIKTAAFERTILSDKKLAALPRLLPQDASGFFKDRREPDNIGIAMPVGWDQSGAPATEQEPQVRAGRRASDAKMAEPGVSFRHLDWLDYANLGFFSVLAAGFGAAFWLSPPCPWRRIAIQRNDGDLHLVFAGVVPRKTHRWPGAYLRDSLFARFPTSAMARRAFPWLAPKRLPSPIRQGR
jgi:hypothetical protein